MRNGLSMSVLLKVQLSGWGITTDWIAWVATTPNTKAPSSIKIALDNIRSLLLVSEMEEFSLKVTWKRHIPGKMKMNTDAKLPRNPITSPILGMNVANSREIRNQGSPISNRLWRLVSCEVLFASGALPFAMSQTSIITEFKASRPQKSKMG